MSKKNKLILVTCTLFVVLVFLVVNSSNSDPDFNHLQAEYEKSEFYVTSESFGPIPKTIATSTDPISEVKKLFNNDELVSIEPIFSEGDPDGSAYMMYPSTPEAVQIYITDEFVLFSTRGVSSSEIPSSKWKVSGGVELGMSLENVNIINTVPISIYGTGWDYSFMQASLNKGKISEDVTLYFGSTKESELTAEEFNSISGMIELDSTNPLIDKLDLFVTGFDIKWMRGY
jgi:hypothetical protein